MNKSIKLTALFVLLMLFVAWAPSCRHGCDALWVMADLAEISLPWSERRAAVTRVGLPAARQAGVTAADLYLPAARARAGLVLVPGAAPDGRNDQRLVEFATAVARPGIVVLVPDIVSMRELRPDQSSVGEIAAAVSRLRKMDILTPDGRVGIGAFSVAVGPAVLAALSPGHGEPADFLLLVGGYHDLVRTLTYFTTGYFGVEGNSEYRAPDAYGKWVYALGNAQRLRDPDDRQALSRFARAELEQAGSGDPALLERLSPAGRSVYELIVNEDPARVPDLIAALPPWLQEQIAALDLAERDLEGYSGTCILVHGLDDKVIPYTESVSLAAAFGQCDTTLYLLEGLQHVDRKFNGLDTWRFWRTLSLLMAQRK